MKTREVSSGAKRVRAWLADRRQRRQKAKLVAEVRAEVHAEQRARFARTHRIMSWAFHIYLLASVAMVVAGYVMDHYVLLAIGAAALIAWVAIAFLRGFAEMAVVALLVVILLVLLPPLGIILALIVFALWHFDGCDLF